MRSRKRDSNFSTEEMYFLIECLERHIPILENKRTDSVTSQAKRAAWRKIEQAFESNPHCRNRKSVQLETKWKGLKKTAKIKIAEVRKARESADGDPLYQEMPDIYQKVYEMVPQRFEQIDNGFDDDFDINLKLLQQAADSKNTSLNSGEHSEVGVEAEKLIQDSFEPPPKQQRKSASSVDRGVKATKPVVQATTPVPNGRDVSGSKHADIEHETRAQIFNEECERKKIIDELQITALKSKIYASNMKADYYKEKILRLQQNETEDRNSVPTPPKNGPGREENLSCEFLNPCSSEPEGTIDNGGDSTN